MLKKLFNNPWFVAGIGACALIYLGIAVVAPLVMDDPVDYADDEALAYVEGDDEFYDETVLEDLYLDEAGPEAEAESEAGQGGSRENIAWLYDIDRDPFAGTFLDRQTIDAVDLPRIGALFVGEDIRAAVVNDRLVREGDTIAQFYVDAIDKERVVLRRAGILYTLEPEA